jgi:phytoene dehydrogenase-like protein
MGLVSPFLSSLDLEAFGLRWCWPEIDLAHPLDTGSAGVLWRDIGRTVEHLGPDGAMWRRLYGRLTDSLDDLAHGYGGDATEVIVDQIERFAPGFCSRIVGRRVRDVAHLEAYNANYIGGDIGTGANDMTQIVFRPRVAIDPYATGIPGVYLCSSATPPGAGVHGMCGLNAAESALRHLAR